jgi:hypothetical protein
MEVSRSPENTTTIIIVAKRLAIVPHPPKILIIWHPQVSRVVAAAQVMEQQLALQQK